LGNVAMDIGSTGPMDSDAGICEEDHSVEKAGSITVIVKL
jgi:hypothetical protein